MKISRLLAASCTLLVFAACTTTQKPVETAAPPVVPAAPVVKDMSMEELQSVLGMTREKFELGYDERQFDSCTSRLNPERCGLR